MSSDADQTLAAEMYRLLGGEEFEESRCPRPQALLTAGLRDIGAIAGLCRIVLTAHLRAVDPALEDAADITPQLGRVVDVLERMPAWYLRIASALGPVPAPTSNDHP